MGTKKFRDLSTDCLTVPRNTNDAKQIERIWKLVSLYYVLFSTFNFCLYIILGFFYFLKLCPLSSLNANSNPKQ